MEGMAIQKTKMLIPTFFVLQVFQVLLLEGENKGPNALRNAQNMTITKAQFEAFLARHRAQKCLVPEDNDAMENSYLLLDEYMRYIQILIILAEC